MVRGLVLVAVIMRPYMVRAMLLIVDGAGCGGVWTQKGAELL